MIHATESTAEQQQTCIKLTSIDQSNVNSNKSRLQPIELDLIHNPVGRYRYSSTTILTTVVHRLKMKTLSPLAKAGTISLLFFVFLIIAEVVLADKNKVVSPE
jgi:hypothetical protein